ncbi:MAG: nucleotide pyrophosphohydrolase [candidate division WOR-3 bacterium]|nr:nucleotide pyrophosphohydrolase [candidate division WOR-3 bacterium]
MEIREFQKLIEKIYYKKDKRRGKERTFLWFCEEIGELARALKRGDKKDREEEFADVFAWLVTLASLYGIDMEKAIEKYKKGCPKCQKIPCECREKRIS